MQPMDDRDGFIWVDGEIKPWRDVNTHFLTHGLHYASSVFEGARAYNGQIYKMQDHHERLHLSATLLDFTIPWTVEQINEAAMSVLKANNIVDGYVRPMAWRGSKAMGISGRNNTIHLGIAAWEWPSYFKAEKLMSGITMDVATWRRPDPSTIPCFSKAAGLYMICTLSKHEAEAKNLDDALMLDYRGYIAEATGANIFFLMDDGKLHTPKPDCFLDGITRRSAISLAARNQMQVVERHITYDEISQASEVFLTGTAVEITPVGQIGDYKFTPSDFTVKMMKDYQSLVHGEFDVTLNKVNIPSLLS